MCMVWRGMILLDWLCFLDCCLLSWWSNWIQSSSFQSSVCFRTTVLYSGKQTQSSPGGICYVFIGIWGATYQNRSSISNRIQRLRKTRFGVQSRTCPKTIDPTRVKQRVLSSWRYASVRYAEMKFSRLTLWTIHLRLHDQLIWDLRRISSEKISVIHIRIYITE